MSKCKDINNRKDINNSKETKNSQIVKICTEKEEQYRETEYVTMKAFWNLHGPGADEYLLVKKLRDDAIYVPQISRIAVMNGKVVGTIMYSKAKVYYGNFTKEVLTFGPLCVDPAAQDYGVGGKLLRATLELAKKSEYDAIIIFGEPGYYPKHGFVTCDKLQVTTMDGSNFDAFMGYELKPGALTKLSEKMGCKGKFEEGEVFENLPSDEVNTLYTELTKLFRKDISELIPMNTPYQWTYKNAQMDKEGYELIDAVQFKPVFKELFNVYVHEWNSFQTCLEKQTLEIKNRINYKVEECFADANKKPFVILTKDGPIGLLVLAAAYDRMMIEELFVTIPNRRKGIAGDIVKRIWQQNDLPCDFCIHEKNENAVCFWNTMIQQEEKKYSETRDEYGILKYNEIKERGNKNE